MIQMTESFGVTTDVALDAFEEQHQIKLPAAYRSFLKAHNGGIPASEDDLPIPGWGESIVNIFNGLDLEGNRGKSYGLSENTERFSDRFPVKEVLIIADDPGGNQFLLGVSPERHGIVYFWDHEAWDDEAEDCLPELIKIDDAFDVFIARLK
jgi:hypothetical protein